LRIGGVGNLYRRFGGVLRVKKQIAELAWGYLLRFVNRPLPPNKRKTF
jgi:hypothetical protein